MGHSLTRRPWWLVLVLASALAAVGADDELTGNRRLHDTWREDPDHHRRLLRDLRAFYALPPGRQEEIRRLDRELFEADVTTQARLWNVIDRYAGWLAKQSKADQQRVREAPTKESRLAVIREIRDREWVERLPAKVRDEIVTMPADKQPGRIAEVRAEERRQQNIALRGTPSKTEPNLRPSKRTQFTPEVQKFLDGLVPRLTPGEESRLRLAEGKWPDLPRVVRELAEAHPVLPPLPTGEIKTQAELPPEVRRILRGLDKKPKGKGGLGKSATRWPEYAIEVAKLMKAEKQTIPPLGASKPDEFPPAIQDFLRLHLFPKLSGTQLEELTKLEGRWPDYPQQLLRLAREKQLVIPGMSLPGPVEVWENARLSLRDVPDHLLLQFARYEAGPDAVARWGLTKGDPVGGRQKVKDEWYRKMLEQERRKREAAALGATP